MRYVALKTDIIDPDMYSPEWEKAEEGFVDIECWGGYSPIPKTSFKMLSGPEGISVLMHTNETNLRSEVEKENGPICTDSCMEFFFKPDCHDLNYLNFEFNPKGVLHLGIGAGRHGRTHLEEDRHIFSIESSAKDGDWTLKFYIPYSFLRVYFKKVSPVCKGNFYKCGDDTGHEHYGVWSRVEHSVPDYHVPDFFGFIEL